MPQEVTDRDDLGPVFQEVGGKGMPQTMATRRDPGGFGVALHLLLDRFDGEGLLRAFAVPKDIALRSGARMVLQALLDTGHCIGGHIHASILAPFALDHAEGLLLPIDLLQLELGHLRDAQPTAEHHQKQGAVHRMVDLGKQALDLLAGERFGQGTPTPHKVTGLDGVPHHPLLVQAKVKKVLQGIEPPVDRRPRPAVLMLVLHKLVDLAKGDLGEGDSHLRKEQAQIQV